MLAGLNMRSGMAWGLGLIMGLLVGAGAFVGAWSTQLFGPEAKSTFPEIPLSATATHGGETFAMCTGPIDEQVEGVFVLDFLTGDLQCAVISHRTLKFNGLFGVNVTNDLAVDKTKKPKYLMVTGNIQAQKGTAAAKPALTLVYVLDENTGHFCVYGLPWRPELANAGQPQKDKMTLFDQGKARIAKIN